MRAGPAVLRAPGAPDGLVDLFVRPHRVRLLVPGETADNVLDGVVSTIDYTGEAAQLVVATAAGPVPVDIGTVDEAWRGARHGQAVRLGWRAADTLCFPRETG